MVTITIEGDAASGKTSKIIPAIKESLASKGIDFIEVSGLSTYQGMRKLCETTNSEVVIIDK